MTRVPCAMGRCSSCSFEGDWHGPRKVKSVGLDAIALTAGQNSNASFSRILDANRPWSRFGAVSVRHSPAGANGSIERGLTSALLRVTLPPVSSEAPPPRERDDRERSRLERIVPDLVKKLLEVGVEKLVDGPDSLRQLLSDVKLPREAILLVLSQMDETKKDIARVLARELREFLERSSVSDELSKLLTGLTLEVKTQVRFVPNSAPSGRPRPKIKTKVELHADSAGPPAPAEEPRSESDSSNPTADSTRQPASAPPISGGEHGRTGEK